MNPSILRRCCISRRLERAWFPLSAARRCLSTAPTHNALRVLFCGADDFSIYSLRALHDLHLKQPDKLTSIHVVCKKDKRVGRGLKKIQEVPIKGVANQLGLPLHQIDTFTGWTPPSSDGLPINLIIAVSFGLLVPPRILNAAQYGGLNVHPSMLPDLRGPAPLHHTLLNRLTHTGVTLQTLHPKHFDHGLIVAQTPSPGLPIPDLETATPESLLAFVGPLGADLLCRSVDTGSFVNPQPRPQASSLQVNTLKDVAPLRHAPKITPEDRHIDWATWTASEILLRDRVLGRLWDDVTTRNLGLDAAASGSLGKRITFGQWRDVSEWVDAGLLRSPALHGQPVMLDVGGERRLCFHSCNGGAVSPSEVTIEGRRKGKGTDAVFINALSKVNDS